MRTSFLGAVFSILLVLFVVACGREAPPPAEAKVDRARLDQFAPLPELVMAAPGSADAALVDLGRMLYYEKRLSKSQQLSCNTCHDLAAYGIDGNATSPGHKGQLGERNSPTVYNAAMHVSQFWDGRAADVEAQAKGPVLNPVEMAMPDEATVLLVIRSIPGYAPLFQA